MAPSRRSSWDDAGEQLAVQLPHQRRFVLLQLGTGFERHEIGDRLTPFAK